MMNLEEIAESSLHSVAESLKEIAAAQACIKMAAEANSILGVDNVPRGGHPAGQPGDSDQGLATANDIFATSVTQGALTRLLDVANSRESLPINDANIVSLIDNRGGSASFDNQVAHALKAFPRPLLEIAKKTNLSVVTAPYYSDITSERKHEQPPGYAPGSTWKDVPAAVRQQSDSTVIGLSEKKLGADKRSIKSAVAHELGHVIDTQLKPAITLNLGAIDLRLDLQSQASDSPDFQLAYYQDLAKLKPEQMQELSYYVRPESGRGETFAELVQFAVNGSSYSNLPVYFPETLRVVRAKINMPSWQDKLAEDFSGGATQTLGRYHTSASTSTDH